MKKRAAIHDIDTLEREIYRLKLRAKDIESQLERNVSVLQDNFWSMLLKSVRGGKDQDGKSGVLGSIFRNQSLNNAIGRVADHLAELAADGINALIDKLFEKKKT